MSLVFIAHFWVSVCVLLGHTIGASMWVGVAMVVGFLKHNEANGVFLEL